MVGKPDGEGSSDGFLDTYLWQGNDEVFGSITIAVRNHTRNVCCENK